jgi:urease accessory protein
MLQAHTWLPRTHGAVRLAFQRRGERTELDVLHQSGAARARFPNTDFLNSPQAVLLNTAGGLTGGDHFSISLTLKPGASLTTTTASAEKIYRSRDGEAVIRTAIDLGAGADLAWLPQPTILFDAARFDRRTDVAMAADARFLAVEILIFGRAAMGEDVHSGSCRDVWRIRRDGALVFADSLILDGPIARMLDRPAALDGARASATLIYAAPDAAARLQPVRALWQSAKATIGASSWNGLLVARATAGDGRTLQSELAPVLELLSGRPLPRVWQC